jgi:hypothetical protein
MPPRQSADAGASAAGLATTSALSLPHAVVLHIFNLLPVDCRLRCAEVCRDWRAVLSERRLWTRLDLTAASGVLVRQAALDALLRCAAARAGGGLQSLHVDKCLFTHAALLEVATANAGALRELHARNDPNHPGFTPVQAEALLDAAPQLHVLATDLECDAADVQAARRALHNEAPFGPLRVVHLHANLNGVARGEAGVVAFAADVAAHASLRGLSLNHGPLDTAAALDAVVDAALARGLQSVALRACGLPRASAPAALARLLDGDALTTLECSRSNFLDAPAAAVLAAALRGNSTLTSLALNDVGVFRDAAAAAELLGALTGHASLRMLSLRGNVVAAPHRAAAGASLGALVAANAPALAQLDVWWCDLGDDGLRPLFEALPHNAHLRELDCSYNSGMSEAFARDALLPAVRANASLRTLVAGTTFESAAEAERVVSSRAAA